MFKGNQGPDVDRIGMIASTLCAIHCAVVPVLLTSLPLIGLGFLANQWFEWGMILFALIVGIGSLAWSFLHTHRRPAPLILFIAGFVYVVSGHLWLHGWKEAIVVPLGGLSIVTAHFINRRYCCNCIRPTAS
jgi:MerC mercury resistance protein